MSRHRLKGTPETAARATAAKRYTAAEVHRHLEAVEQLLLQSATNGQVARAMKAEFGVGRDRTTALINRVLEKWDAERAEDRKHDHARIVGMVRRAIAQVEAKMAEKGLSPGQWADLNRLRSKYIDQLMDLTGARAPEEVTVNLNATVNNTILAVVAALNPEQVEKLKARRRARELEAPAVVSETRTLPPYSNGSAE